MAPVCSRRSAPLGIAGVLVSVLACGRSTGFVATRLGQLHQVQRSKDSDVAMPEAFEGQKQLAQPLWGCSLAAGAALAAVAVRLAGHRPVSASKRAASIACHAEPSSIAATAVANGNFKTLVAALGKAGLVDILSGSDAFTVFAPTDDAFKALLAELGATAEQLLERPDLKSILLYHVAPGKALSTSLKDGQQVCTVQGSDLAVKIADGKVQVGTAGVTAADVACSNGVIHIIDKVLLPPPSIAATAVANGNFKTLVAALGKAGLVDTLSGSDAFTVFAPTDDAFKSLLAELGATAEQLLERPDLKSILLYHVAPGKALSTSLKDGQQVGTVQGSELTLKIADGKVQVGTATVTAADVACSNGVIHVIDKVLLPPA